MSERPIESQVTLPPWAEVSPKRLAHISRVTALLESWAAAMKLPEDEAIDAPEVPAADGPRPFVREKSILQREAITDNVALERGAYGILAVLAGVPIGYAIARRQFRGRTLLALSCLALAKLATISLPFFLKYIVSHPAVPCAVPGMARA